MEELIESGAGAEVIPQGTPSQSTIRRDVPDPPQARAAFLQSWAGRIKQAKKHWEKDFKRMREDMDFVFMGCDKEWSDFDRYTANIVQQYVRQRVARLYAKNPKFVCKRRPQLDFILWDEKPESMQLAMEQAQSGDPVAMTMAMELQADIQEGMLRRQQIDRVAKTMEMLFEDNIKEQSPNFKKQMKQLIRRVETTGVGWVKIDYQRVMQPRPDEETQVNDISHRLARLERLEGDKVDQKFDENAPENEELEQGLAQLQREPEIIVREGLVFSFPRATAIIPDTQIRSLEGLQGADWIVEEATMTVDEIKEIYKTDIGSGFKTYTEKGQENNQTDLFSSGKDGYAAPVYALVWHVYDKKSGYYFVMADGFKDYLRPPGPPPVTLETFFPYVVLMFNELEHEKQVFPLSDVRLLRHIQKEYNRAKEALRQHRIASAPLYATGAGQFDEEDQLNLALHNPHDVIVLKALGEGENVNNKLQQVKKYPIDPNVYQTEDTFQDLTRVAGADDSAMGSTSSNVTATDSSIANDSRMSSLSSNTDDLDEFMGELARLGGQVLLLEMSVEEVKKRVGRGAVWPELTRQQIMEEIFLTIEAGSSGRPNKAAKAAALERTGNIILSLPGVNPRWMFKQIMMTVDEQVDLTDAYMEGQPSIMMMNRMAATAQTAPGGGPNDPTNQGDNGANNQQAAPQTSGGPQPAYTPPGAAQNQFVGS
jgi:hypothetical protein